MNRRKTIIRFLYWDKTGFAVWSKTLDRERYRWPGDFDDASKLIDYKNLEQILSGMDITTHKTLEFEKAV